MVYDSFQFFNELDILKMRMHILNEVVDKFVISESTVTFSGEKKPLYFNENKKMFEEFSDKIIHVIVEDTPQEANAFERDSHQKCAVARGLKECTDEDIIIFSDVDEIPNPEKISEIVSTIEDGKIYCLAQRNFYCFLNMEEVSGNLLSVTGEFDNIDNPKWLGSKVCKYSLLKEFTTEELRNKEQKSIGIRVENGGWHFSYMGGTKNSSVEERVKHKIKSAAHQEYNNKKVLSHVRKNISEKKDIFGRESRFEVVPINDTFPLYLREHIDEYEYLLYRKPKLIERLLRRYRND